MQKRLKRINYIYLINVDCLKKKENTYEKKINNVNNVVNKMVI